jgi:hypothetical protein
VSVVALPAAAGRTDLPDRPKPVAKVVSMLEELLDKARAGEIRAVSAAYVAGADGVLIAYHRFAWSTDEHDGYPMGVAVSCMHHDYYRQKIENQEVVA